ncbi:hypothetical protein NUW54_g7100 [Trametes sanguinea]|uniref:Uncharacterized protein n=1 Tax=Trametes sanguinea TaxID=158606 RepID=A0ACC1PNS1_9APHY|nr:hypothetical protein NUW54_g7100 [Trametes sanguinea]
MSHSAFFYGTLLHPAILRRVIGHDGIQLQICPAILLVSHHNLLTYSVKLAEAAVLYDDRFLVGGYLMGELPGQNIITPCTAGVSAHAVVAAQILASCRLGSGKWTILGTRSRMRTIPPFFRTAGAAHSSTSEDARDLITYEDIFGTTEEGMDEDE